MWSGQICRTGRGKHPCMNEADNPKAQKNPEHKDHGERQQAAIVEFYSNNV